MDRRTFIRPGIAGSTTGIIAPRIVLAGTMGAKIKSPMAGGVFYTKDAPGRWSKKVGGHLPKIDTSKAYGKLEVQVVTAHEMKGFEHYIIKHVLLNGDFGFISENRFDPGKDEAPISNFELDTNYSGAMYALSACNIHDSWLNVIEV